MVSIVYNFFDKKSASLAEKSTADSGVANNEIKQNLQLAEGLHKPIIRNFKKRRLYSEFKDNIWVADLADTQLIGELNKGFRFLLCVIEYAWVVPLKDKKGVSVVNAFQKILDQSGRKPNKLLLTKEVNFKTILLKNG